MENIKINNIKNISAFNCAIGEKVEFISFFEPEGHLTNGSLDYKFAKNFTKSISVSETLVIDGSILEKLVEKSERTLIKIDTEGSEYTVLHSLKSLITRNKIDLVIEVLSSYEKELNNLEFLFAKNYSFFNITDQGLVKHEKFVANNQFRDYILLPPED